MHDLLHYQNRLIRRTEFDGVALTPEDFFYDDTQTILRQDEQGRVTNRYLWGPVIDQLMADQQIDWTGAEPEVNTLWALTDHQQSVRDLLDYNPATDTSQVVSHRVYTAFGSLAIETLNAYSALPAAEQIAFGYTGRYFDIAVALQYNLNRWYDSESMQWISEDPKGFAAGDPNLRRYVGNDPVGSIDPDGLDRIIQKGNKVYWQIQKKGFGGWWNTDVGDPIYLGERDNGEVLLDGDFAGTEVWFEQLKKTAARFNHGDGNSSLATQQTLVQGQLRSLLRHEYVSVGTQFGRGLETGGKANWNAGAATVVGFITLGTEDGEEYQVAVTQEDLDNGYTAANIIARVSQETLLAVATGSAANKLAATGNKMAAAGQKLTTAAKSGKVAAIGLTTWDAAGNVSQFSLGASTVDIEGVTLDNSLKMVSGGVGMGGHAIARLPPEAQEKLSKSLFQTVRRTWRDESTFGARAPKKTPEHQTFEPGPFASESIPARSTSQTFLDAEREAIDAIGYKTGCHTCGALDPGTKTGHYVPDHQPVSRLNIDGEPQRLYPHCIHCSRDQGLAVIRLLRKAKRE